MFLHKKNDHKQHHSMFQPQHGTPLHFQDTKSTFKKIYERKQIEVKLLEWLLGGLHLHKFTCMKLLSHLV